MAKILAIDTSCDDTSVAILENNRILSNCQHTDLSVHSEWGGVIPGIAKRNHIENFDKVLDLATSQAKVNLSEIDFIAVTYGPGLAIALEVGIAKAKELSRKYGKRIIPVNHMIGHIYSNWVMSEQDEPFSIPIAEQNNFPIMALLISGGHSEIVMMEGHMKFKIVGQTRDDAIGESFDKVARFFEWGYPGGPIIEKFASQSTSNRFHLPLPLRGDKTFDFSYSGLKSAVLRIVQEVGSEIQVEENLNQVVPKGHYIPTPAKFPRYNLDHDVACDLAAAFQQAATAHLIDKVAKAIKFYKPKMLILGGGVVNSIYIRSELKKVADEFGIKLYFPTNAKLLTDNAAMIGAAGYFMSEQNMFAEDIDLIDRVPRLEIC